MIVVVCRGAEIRTRAKSSQRTRATTTLRPEFAHRSRFIDEMGGLYLTSVTLVLLKQYRTRGFLLDYPQNPQVCPMSFIPSINRLVPKRLKREYGLYKPYSINFPEAGLKEQSIVLGIAQKRPLGAFAFGADRENRTPDSSLARTRFTTKPYPLREAS